MFSVATTLLLLLLLIVVSLVSGSVKRTQNEDATDDDGCPWWIILPVNETSCSYECGKNLGGIIVSNPAQEMQLRGCHCVTPNTGGNTTVVGACIFSSDTAFQPVCLIRRPCNAYESPTCTDYNRQSQLCGQCIPGFAPAVYSYSMSCVNCTEYKYNWLKYLAVAFVPLTVFYFIIVMFHITVTSATVNAFILVSQIVASPIVTRQAFLYANKTAVGVKSILGVWNLDFFRAVYPQFCFSPSTSILHVLALDYAVAAYPLMLIVITYVLVKLHDRGCIIIRCMWRPFHFCFARVRSYWGVKYSLVDCFATFLLLSYCKFLFVSIDILTPVKVYDSSGKYGVHVFLNASMEYFGAEHVPFAVLAIAVLFVFIFIPTMLMLLYPCRCFQKFLNYFHLRSHVLHTFMDTYQGYFKDGTNGTRDCRYFAAVYLLFRVVGYTSCGFGTFSMMPFIAFLVGLIGSLLLIGIQPYKSKAANIINIMIMLFLLFSSVIVVGSQMTVCISPQIYTIFVKLLNLSGILLILICVCILIYVLKSFLRRQISWLCSVFRHCLLVVCHTLSVYLSPDEQPQSENEVSALLPQPLTSDDVV